MGRFGTTSKGNRVSLGGDENVLNLIMVMTVQLGEYAKTIELYALNR